jgi:hypothetical protein
LVIGSKENSIGDFLGIVMIPRLNAELLAGPKLSQDVGKIVLRNAEEDGNGLQLGNDDNAAGIGRANDIAFVHQSQTDLSANWSRDFRIRNL